MNQQIFALKLRRDGDLKGVWRLGMKDGQPAFQNLCVPSVFVLLTSTDGARLFATKRPEYVSASLVNRADGKAVRVYHTKDGVTLTVVSDDAVIYEAFIA